MVRASASGNPDDLELLSEWLRGLQPHWSLKVDPAEHDLGLDPDEMRTIALHLLRNGVTGLEVENGLGLMAPVVQDEDVEMLREIALLQGDFGYRVTVALRGVANSAATLYWLASRSLGGDQRTYTDPLGSVSGEAIDALLDTLSAAEVVALLRMTSLRPHTPQWLKRNQRIAAILAAASADAELFGELPDSLVAVVQLRDDLLYGHSAFLGFTPDQRAAVTGNLRAMLLAPDAMATVQAAMEADPADSTLIWLFRRITQCRRESDDFPPGLAIRYSTTVPGGYEGVHAHLLADGVPLVKRMFDSGFPDNFAMKGLRAEPELHAVRLATAECDADCCGVLLADIRRDSKAGRVEWKVEHTHRNKELAERFSFDAGAYDAEVARADADYSWEWPALRAARLLKDRLRAEPELLSRWDCHFYWSNSWNRDRSTMRLTVSYPEPPDFKSGRPWLQFAYSAEIPDAAEVDDAAINSLVDGIADLFRTTDPKSVSRICGGTQASAEALGIPWNPPDW